MNKDWNKHVDSLIRKVFGPGHDYSGKALEYPNQNSGRNILERERKPIAYSG